MLDEHKNSVINIIKWFFLATAVGVVVGVLDAVFLQVLDGAIAYRNGVPYFYFGLPLVLYVVAVLAHKTAKKDKDFSTDAVINKINSYRPISFLSIVKGYLHNKNDI